jgi:hypothetical protein
VPGGTCRDRYLVPYRHLDSDWHKEHHEHLGLLEYGAAPTPSAPSAVTGPLLEGTGNGEHGRNRTYNLRIKSFLAVASTFFNETI